MSILNALLTSRFPLYPCSLKLLVTLVFVVPTVIAVPAISGHAGEITLALDDQQNDAKQPLQNSDSTKEDSAEGDSAGEDSSEADSNPLDSAESNQVEQEDVCLPVIKILVRRRENSEVAALRRDLEDGKFDKVAVDLRTGSRIKDQPKIMVPISPERYRVWYGYHSGIRQAVIRTAEEFGKQLPYSSAQNEALGQRGYASNSNRSTSSSSGDSEQDTGDHEEPVEGVREGGYPTRTSWWTVGKKHPEKEGMVKHLSGGPHKGRFDLLWLETLTRDELHSLHSDDHEEKVNWLYAKKPSVTPEADSEASSENPEADETPKDTEVENAELARS